MHWCNIWLASDPHTVFRLCKIPGRFSRNDPHETNINCDAFLLIREVKKKKKRKYACRQLFHQVLKTCSRTFFFKRRLSTRGVCLLSSHPSLFLRLHNVLVARAIFINGQQLLLCEAAWYIDQTDDVTLTIKVEQATSDCLVQVNDATTKFKTITMEQHNSASLQCCKCDSGRCGSSKLHL